MKLERKIKFREIDADLLEKVSSFFSAKFLIKKFEKHYGKIPTEQDFYEVYLKYLECKNMYGSVFRTDGMTNKPISSFLSPNFPELRANQFGFLEDYLFHRKIIKEKVF